MAKKPAPTNTNETAPAVEAAPRMLPLPSELTFKVGKGKANQILLPRSTDNATFTDAQLVEILRGGCRTFNDWRNPLKDESEFTQEGLTKAIVSDPDKCLDYWITHVLGAESAPRAERTVTVSTPLAQAIKEYVSAKRKAETIGEKWKAAEKANWSAPAKDKNGQDIMRVKGIPSDMISFREYMDALNNGKLSDVSWAKVSAMIESAAKKIEAERTKLAQEGAALESADELV